MDKIAVLIPCYNESATIAKVVQDYRAALPDAAIYVYDNNSTDGTDEIARAAGNGRFTPVLRWTSFSCPSCGTTAPRPRRR